MGNKLLKFLIVVIFLGVCGIVIYRQFMTRPSQSPETPSSQTPKTVPSSKEELHISFYQSKGKKDWVNEVVAEFNNGNFEVNDKRIVVDVHQVRSGDSMQKILDGKIQPTIWNPASKAWIELINHTWKVRHGKELISSFWIRSMIALMQLLFKT